MATNNNLNDLLTGIAEAIRYKKNTLVTSFSDFCDYSNNIFGSGMPTPVAATSPKNGITLVWNAIVTNRQYAWLWYYKNVNPNNGYTTWGISVFASDGNVYIDGSQIKTTTTMSYYTNMFNELKEGNRTYGPSDYYPSNLDLLFNRNYWSNTYYNMPSSWTNLTINRIIPASEMFVGGGSTDPIVALNFPTEILNL